MLSSDVQYFAGILDRIRTLMGDGLWRTPEEIQLQLGDRTSTQTITSRLRDLRKEGYHLDVRRRLGCGRTCEYRLVAVVRDLVRDPDFTVLSALEDS